MGFGIYSSMKRFEASSLKGWMDSIIFVSFFSNFLMESLPTGSQKGRGFDELTTLYTNSAAFLRVAVLLVIVAQGRTLPRREQACCRMPQEGHRACGWRFRRRNWCGTCPALLPCFQCQRVSFQVKALRLLRQRRTLLRRRGLRQDRKQN